MHADQKWVHSDTLGLIRFKDASVKVAQATREFPIRHMGACEMDEAADSGFPLYFD